MGAGGHDLLQLLGPIRDGVHDLARTAVIGHGDLRPGVLELVEDLLGPELRVDRDPDRTELPDRLEGGDEVGMAAAHHRDPVVTLDPEVGQPAGKPPGPVVELAEGEARVVRDEGHLVRQPRRGLLEVPGQRHGSLLVEPGYLILYDVIR